MGWRKVYNANTNQNKAWVALLHLDKIHFGTTKVSRVRGVLRNDKGISSSGRLIILNLYAPDNNQNMWGKNCYNWKKK